MRFHRLLLLLSLTAGLILSVTVIAAADMTTGEASAGSAGSSFWELNADSAGMLHISDYTGNAVQSVHPPSGSYTRYLFDGGAPFAVQPSDPKPDAGGSLWWSDYLSAFGKLNTSTLHLEYWDLASLALSPGGFAFDTTGHVWFTQPSYTQFLRFSPADNTLCQFEVGGGGDYLVAQGPVLWATDRLAGHLLRFDSLSLQLKSWALPEPWLTPEGLAVDGDGRVWWADSGAGIIGRLSPGTNEAVIYELPSGSQPLMVAPGAEVVWYSDGSGFVGFIDPAQATGATHALPVSTLAPSVGNCRNVGYPSQQSGVLRIKGTLAFSDVTWSADMSQPGVARYALPATGGWPVPWGIAFSQGRTWIVDQGRRILARTPYLPLSPVVSIQLDQGRNHLVWPAVTLDEGNENVSISGYQVWRSDKPYFRPWDSPGVILVGSPVAAGFLDPVSATPAAPVFYGVRSVAESGLLSRTSTHMGAFAFALVR